MKYGLQIPNFNLGQDFDTESPLHKVLGKLIVDAEKFGFDSFWVMDHFHQISLLGEPSEPMLEGWTTISFLAALTSRIRIGTLVTGVIYRYPSVLAKIGSTLDVLSNGRLFLGIGAAWNEEESLAYGIHFPTIKDRFSMLEESVQIIRKMWSKEENEITFNGRFFKIQNAYCNPKPIQNPMPPIMVGGSGEKRTLQIVSKYADACNLFGSTKTIKNKLSILKEHCKRNNRTYENILKTKLATVIFDDNNTTADKKISQRFNGISDEEKREFLIYGNPDQVQKQIEELNDAGIDYLIVNFEPKRELASIDLFANTVMKRIR